MEEAEGVGRDLFLVLVEEVWEAVVALVLFLESFLEQLHLLGHIPLDVLFFFLQIEIKFKICCQNYIFPFFPPRCKITLQWLPRPRLEKLRNLNIEMVTRPEAQCGLMSLCWG